MVNLDPAVGHEQAKKRPCLVISIDSFNQGPWRLVAILPITSKNRNNFLHIQIDPPEGGLLKTSFVMCDQIRTISHDRIATSSFGKVSDETLEKIEYALSRLLRLGL